MSDLDFRETTRAIRARNEAGGEKSLSISLDPGGFVTEVRDYGRMRAPRADTGTLEATMSLNELVFACIAVKATAARDPRLTVQLQKTSGGKVTYEEQSGHPFRSLIMRPNDKMTEGDLMRAAIVSWDVSNPRRFYAEREYKNGLLIGLHPLNPALMRPKYSPSNRDLIGYTWGDGRERREYSLDELLIRSAPSWYDPPPLVAALGATESDTAQTDYIRAFFENGGVPPGLLKYRMPMNDEKRDEIRDKWRSRYGNRFGRQHDIGVLDVNVEWQETGSKLDELQSQTLRSVAESRICMVFGVPPLIVYAYVGLLRATYSNLGEAWRGFWDATMSPLFKELKDFWTWSLLPEFEDLADIRSEKVKLAYDMSTVAALQDDVDAIQTRARANFGGGLISQNEARSAIGYTPITGGDTTFAGRAASPPMGAMSRGGKATKARTRGSVQLTERRIEKAVRTYLAHEYERAAQAVA
jgi:HK97 family phage portal protein